MNVIFPHNNYMSGFIKVISKGREVGGGGDELENIADPFKTNIYINWVIQIEHPLKRYIQFF